MNFIRGLLTRDSICRKERQWTLLTKQEMTQMYKNSEPSRKPEASPEYGDVYVSVRKKVKEYYDHKVKTWKKAQKDAIEILTSKPLIPELLRVFYGKLVIAGGSVFDAVLGINDYSKDVDFFFVDPNVESEGNPETYTEFLVQVITFISENWLGLRSSNFLYVVRNQFVTTVHLHDSPHYWKYQFIHRVYPSVESVLGGFDLGPAMIAFTGKSIVTTELGAWSAFSRSVIVDISRRSTSYEHRLTKYSKKCHVFFPGLPAELSLKEAEFWEEDINHVHDLLFQKVEESGFTVSDRGDGVNLPKFVRKKPMPVSEWTAKMLKSARKHGIEIRNIHDLDIGHIQRSPVQLDVEELWKELSRIAFEKGYRTDFESRWERASFIRDYENREEHDNPDYYLVQRSQVLITPRIAIKLERNHQPYEWSVGVPYKNSRRVSDYEDNTVWAVSIGEKNMTALCHGNLSGTTSVMILKNAGLEMNTGTLFGYDSLIKMTAEGIRDVVRPEDVENFVRESCEKPYFGNIDQMIKARFAYLRTLRHREDRYRRRVLYKTFGAEARDIDEKDLLNKNSTSLQEELKKKL